MHDQPTGRSRADDPYRLLHNHLREVADCLASLIGTGLPGPAYVTVDIATGVLTSSAEKAAPLADTIASALGMQAADTQEGNLCRHGAEVHHPLGTKPFEYGDSDLMVRVFCPIPAPPDTRNQRIAELEAEVAQLRAQQRQPQYPDPGSTIPDQPGFVVAECGHRMAGGAWRAGYRTCERCTAGGQHPPAALDPDTPLNRLPDGYGDDHDPAGCHCEDCTEEVPA